MFKVFLRCPRLRFLARSAVITTACVACGSDASNVPGADASIESTASDASSATETSTASDGGASDAAAGSFCFESDPGEVACNAACSAYAGCNLPGATVTCGVSGGSCRVGGFGRGFLTKCFESSRGDCARLKQCYGCSVACGYLDKGKCAQAAEMGSCCEACTAKPGCYDENLDTCSAVAACK